MLTGTTPILVQPPVDVLAAVRRYIKSRTTKTPYSAAEVDSITWAYFEVCRAGGVDLLFSVTQMVHETAALTSSWSLPPHRNPAGIGVTGEPGLGQSFASWPEAVMCHVGLLLAYNFPIGQGNVDQQRLINFAVGIRPNVPRGVGTTLAEVAAKWAADTAYVTKMETMAKAIAAA